MSWQKWEHFLDITCAQNIIIIIIIMCENDKRPFL